MRNNFISITSMLIGAIFISSCTNNTKQEVKIIHECNGTNVCSLKVGNVEESVSIDLLGKEHILNKKILTSTNSDVTWAGIDTPATNGQLEAVGLPTCDSDTTCSPTDNPTGGIFTTTASTANISVSGSITVNGVTTTFNNLNAGSSWVVTPEDNLIKSVEYTCPAGDNDNRAYTVGTLSSGMTISQTGQGSACKLKFVCPSDYAMAPNAIDIIAPNGALHGYVLEPIVAGYDYNDADDKIVTVQYLSSNSAANINSAVQSWNGDAFWYKNQASNAATASCFPINI